MSTKTVTVNGIRTEITTSPIALRRVYAATYQKEGTLTAEIEQKVTAVSYYPTKRVETSAQNGLFAVEDFGFSENSFTNTETRIAWILVPKNVSEEAVQKQIAIANTKGACIYKVMSSEPYLDENQQYAISQGMRTKDDFANRYVVRYGKNHATTPNQLVLTKQGMVQYRRTFFWSTAKEDIDIRDAAKTYMSVAIAAELSGVQAVNNALMGQTLTFDPGDIGGTTSEESGEDIVPNVLENVNVEVTL